MKRTTPLLLLMLLFLAACSGQETAAPQADVADPLSEPTSLPATAIDAPLPTETAELPTIEPINEPAAEETEAPPTAEPTIPPQPTELPEEVVVVQEEPVVQIISGQTAEGAYFYGDPNAPVTLLDYSDFL